MTDRAERAELLLAAAAIDAIAAEWGESELAESVAAILRDVAVGLRETAAQRDRLR